MRTVEWPRVKVLKPSLARDGISHALPKEERDEQQEQPGDGDRLRLETVRISVPYE